ncbi:GIY-YIG nuclease family protein [Algoriphagus hitonicola]|uniref:Putative endonuclease n=1 Tax=Algoriphagus hitonicola TaxID=435880 RepID=A0A1I2WV24_9BACT|nr:GIY-YIG nuclease family protein [Algoriphagus hitonicola]SFH04449.1 putative endonuclease [Algoriphagus hitonicola]
MEYFVYIIQSELDGTLYVGSSKDPISRLEKHNRPHKGFTARKQPWKLLYAEKFPSKKDALIREKFLKAQKSRAFLWNLIQNQSAG